MPRINLYLSILSLTLLTVLPATANNLPLGTAVTTTTPAAANSPLAAAQQLNQRGAALLAAGKPDKALAAWQEAHQLYAKLKDPQGTIGTKINQAQALQSLGFYRQALVTLQAVNTTLQNRPNSSLKVQGLLALGNSLRALRILEQRTASTGEVTVGSKEVLLQALTIATSLKDRAAIDRINLSLGNTYAAIGGTESDRLAIDTFEKIATDAAPLVRVQAQIDLYGLVTAQKIAPNTQVFLTDTRKILDSISLCLY
jgi:tetratricopeptide (TPR) repeat protein